MTATPLDAWRFPANSRYRDSAVLLANGPDGQPVRYLAPRLVPDPATMTLLRLREVVQGDRLDAIAGSEIGDPELWWRIADAHRVLNPDELLGPIGRRLTIPMPPGMAGGGGV